MQQLNEQPRVKYSTHLNYDLRQRLIETWLGIPQTVIDEAIDEWGLRLRACVKAKGRHFEHSLKPTTLFRSIKRYVATTQQPTLFTATGSHILSKEIDMPSYA